MLLFDLPRARFDFIKLKRAISQFALCVWRFSTVTDMTGIVTKKVSDSALVAPVAFVKQHFGRVRAYGGAGVYAPAGTYTRAHTCRHIVTHSHKYIYVFDLFIFLCGSLVGGACGAGSHCGK